MPELFVSPNQNSVAEGELATFNLSVWPPVDYVVYARVSTVTSGGASSADNDYDGFIDVVYEIPPGGFAVVEVDINNAGAQNEGNEAVGIWVDDVGTDVYPYNQVTIDGDGQAFVDLEEAASDNQNQDSEDHDVEGGDSGSSQNYPTVSFTDAPAVIEGVGEWLQWEITYHNGSNRDWDGSEDGYPEVHYEIINDQTGQVIKSASKRNSNIDAGETEVLRVGVDPLNDNSYTGNTTYTLRVTGLEHLNGPTGNVATGMVLDDEFPGSEGVDFPQDFDPEQENITVVTPAGAFALTVASTVTSRDDIILAVDDLRVQEHIPALQQPLYWEDVAILASRLGVIEYPVDRSISWRGENVPQGQEGIRGGDYIDGRLVIVQPLIGFNADGSLIDNFNSSQGRFNGSDAAMFSHEDEFDHSFDWGGAIAGGRPVYILAPVDGYIVYTKDTAPDEVAGNGGSGLGNFVTMRAADPLFNGDPVFLTFAHLANGSIANAISQEVLPTDYETDETVYVKAGTIIGLMGNTGAGPKHLHMQVGTDLDGNIANADGGTATPPVYMRFGDAITNAGAFNDRGFPDGSNENGTIASGIKPSFTNQDIYFINPDHILQHVGYGAGGGAGGEFGKQNEQRNAGGSSYDDNPLGGSSSGSNNDSSDNSGDSNSVTVVDPNSTGPNVNIYANDTGYMHFIYRAEAGSYAYHGGDGHSQVDYTGTESVQENFTFTQLSDGTVQVDSAAFGTHILQDIDGIWFAESQTYANVVDLVSPDTGNDPTIYGTDQDDSFSGQVGDDVYDGLGGLDQMTYAQEHSLVENFTITDLGGGSYEIVSDHFGVDVVHNMESIWFEASQQWSMLADVATAPVTTTIVEGTDGEDDFTGQAGNTTYLGGAGYDEVKYFGPDSLVENFTFTENSDGTLTVSSDTFGVETYSDIQGVWFDASVEWHTVEALVAMSAAPTLVETSYDAGLSTLNSNPAGWGDINTATDAQLVITDTATVSANSHNYYWHEASAAVLELDIDSLADGATGQLAVTLDGAVYGHNNLAGITFKLVTFEVGTDGVTTDDWDDMLAGTSAAADVSAENLAAGDTFVFNLNDDALAHVEQGGELAILSSYMTDDVIPEGPRDGEWDETSFELTATLEVDELLFV